MNHSRITFPTSLRHLLLASGRSLVAGCAVYGAIAACSTPSSDSAEGELGGPVPSASAAPEGDGAVDGGDASIGPRHSHRRIVAHEKCDKRDDHYNNGGFGEYHSYAEHAFPGRSKEDLSAVRVLFTRTFELNSPPYVPGYETRANYWSATGYASPPDGTLYVKDGSVAVLCGDGRFLEDKNPSVTFVLDEIVPE